MPEVKKEERRISPAIAIIPIGLGLAAVVGLAAVAFAAPEEPPPESTCCNFPKRATKQQPIKEV